MSTETLLVELGTEELPPRALKSLGLDFRDGIVAGLKQRELDFGEVQWFATPRRLAVLIADVQLHTFALTKKPGEIMQSGLWRYSRHPNYFGEFGFWFGIMLFGLAANPQAWWWIIPGATAMLIMFVFVSIPLLDDRSKERRADYGEHMKKVSAFVPWFSKL